MPGTKCCAVEHYARDQRAAEVYGGTSGDAMAENRPPNIKCKVKEKKWPEKLTTSVF